MPVTFKVAPHDASFFDSTHRRQYTSAQQVLGTTSTAHQKSKFCGELLQTSVRPEHLPGFVEGKNGFVHGCITAYNHHHNLVIRPDDLWTCILSQFSLYVNKHAEEMRAHFVAHEGQKELEIKAVGTRYTFDFGWMARAFTEKLDVRVPPPSPSDFDGCVSK